MRHNKLELSEFLKQENLTEEISDNNSLNEDISKKFSCSLSSFYNSILEHTGSFVINDIEYKNIISSFYSIYFYTEDINEQIIIFDPIIEIKEKINKEFLIIYYPETIFNIILKD